MGKNQNYKGTFSNYPYASSKQYNQPSKKKKTNKPDFHQPDLHDLGTPEFLGCLPRITSFQSTDPHRISFSPPPSSSTPLDPRQPLLYVDVNLGGAPGKGSQRIVVCEGDTAESLAETFCESHGIAEESTRTRLAELLHAQIDNVLEKINEMQGEEEEEAAR